MKQTRIKFNRLPVNGQEGWELVEFNRVLRRWLNNGAPDLWELLVYTYENLHTRERRIVERDVSNVPLSTVVLRIGFVSKARFNALAHEIGFDAALAVVPGARA